MTQFLNIFVSWLASDFNLKFMLPYFLPCLCICCLFSLISEVIFKW